jgi:hypothetical protein
MRQSFDDTASTIRTIIGTILEFSSRIDEIPDNSSIERIIELIRSSVGSTLGVIREIYGFTAEIGNSFEGSLTEEFQRSASSIVGIAGQLNTFFNQLFNSVNTNIEISVYSNFVERIRHMNVAVSDLIIGMRGMANLREAFGDLSRLGTGAAINRIILAQSVSEINDLDSDIEKINSQATLIARSFNRDAIEEATSAIATTSYFLNSIATASMNLGGINLESIHLIGAFTNRFGGIIDIANRATEELSTGTFGIFMESLDMSLQENAMSILSEFQAIDRILENELPTVSLSGTLTRFGDAVKLARESIRIETRPININVEISVQLDRDRLLDSLGDQTYDKSVFVEDNTIVQ